MAGMEIANAGYGFACRIDNIKEGAKGNKVISGCEVTEQGTPDMTVDISAGQVVIAEAFVTISAVDNQAVTAADGSNDRYDIIAVGTNGTVDYTAGTAAANPYPPDLPADHILLAVIWVEHGSTTVETSDIHDNRIIQQELTRIIDVTTESTDKSTTGTSWATLITTTVSLTSGRGLMVFFQGPAERDADYYEFRIKVDGVVKITGEKGAEADYDTVHMHWAEAAHSYSGDTIVLIEYHCTDASTVRSNSATRGHDRILTVMELL